MLRKTKSEAEDVKVKPAKSPQRKTAEEMSSNGGRVKTAESAKARAVESAEAGLNRETKRMIKKRENAADRLKRPDPRTRKRTRPAAFIREVRGELARVAWPTRPEVITYSTVVLITVIFFMLLIAGIDFVALKGILFLIGLGGR